MPRVRQDVLEVVRVPVLDGLVLPRREEAMRARDKAERHAVILVREEGAVFFFVSASMDRVGGRVRRQFKHSYRAIAHTYICGYNTLTNV